MNFYFHLSSKLKGKEVFTLEKNELWNKLLTSCHFLNQKFSSEVVSLVLMDNHYHLILYCSFDVITQYTQELNQLIEFATSQQIERPFIQSLRQITYRKNCYRYIYQNPRRAGLKWSCENYAYSTLYYYYWQLELPATFVDRFGPCDEYKLYWINQQTMKNVSLAN